MSRPSRFDVAQRRAAVTRAFEGGAGPEDVARELGVHPATVYRWAGELTGGRATQQAEGDREAVAERLVRCAQELLREHEYPDITMTSLADRAGVSVRSAYQRFATKQDLFGAAVDDAATEIIEQIALGIPREPTGDPLQRLEELLLTAARRVYSVPAAHVLFCEAGLPRGIVDAGRWHQLFVDVVARHLHEARKVGQIGLDDDPERLAVGIVGGVRGVHAAVLGGGVDPETGLRLVRQLAQVGASSSRSVGA
ncbi:MAG: transposase [Aeromicrobium erythreum]